MPREDQQGYAGLSNLAHSIRRSMAAYVAVQMTPPDGSLADWEANADHVAQWIKGSAGSAEEQPDVPQGGSLGVSWHDRDGA